MPLDNYVAAEILATCSALGSEVRGVYVKTNDTINCLKDLIKYLKRDDDEHSVLRQLGEIKLVQSDLLPILKRYNKNKEIFDLTLRLLVILLNPALLLFNEELPEDKLELNVYLSIVAYLQTYKQAFTDSKVWVTLQESLKTLLSLSFSDRDEDDRLTVERILIVIRNVLHIPPDDISEKRTDDDVSVHDQVLWALHLSAIDDLLLYLASSEEEQQYSLHIIEIISLMLREQTPEILVTSGNRRTLSEKEQDERRLVSVRRKEYETKMQREKLLSSRRFNGVYYVKNLKSISDRDHISHKLISNMDVKFDSESLAKRIPKNRLPVRDINNSRRSTVSICMFLKDFCSEFVNNSYNTFMSTVKRNLNRNHSQDHDDSYYLWAISYFLEFNRHSNFQLAVVSETISNQTFHYVQTQIDNYYDILRSDKKKAKSWSRRMHLGLKAYKELLATLKVMESSSDETVKMCANVIESNIFYVDEYREMILSLLMNYNELLFSKLYLEDLIQTAALFIKMLEDYNRSHSLVVQTKQRKKKKKSTKTSKLKKSADHEIETQWDDIATDLLIVLQGENSVPVDVTPFDATSSLSFEEQKTNIIYKIQAALKEKAASIAVALLRAARDLWPENDSFGPIDIKPEDEALLLKEIFLANLPKVENIETPAVEEMEVDMDDEEDEYNEMNNFAEKQLNISEFVQRFASPKVVRPCCLLFMNYKTNSLNTNKSLLKLMHRIAWDCKMYSLFYQASLFTAFQTIFNDSDVNYDSITKEFSRFAKFIMSKFFQTVEKNKKVFVEMLFWKGSKEAYEIEEGYGTATQKKPMKSLWNEEEEEELKKLYEEYKGSLEDGDIIRTIIANISRIRTRREIIARLKHMGLIRSVRDLKPPKACRSMDWQEAEIMELQTLYDNYKESDDVINAILPDLTVKRAKKAITMKLLELGLISSVQDLKKSRKKAQNIVHIS